MCVCRVYLLCIYKDKHTVYIWKILTCIYLIHIMHIIYKYVNITYFSEMYAYVCIYICIMNIHSTHIHNVNKIFYFVFIFA